MIVTYMYKYTWHNFSGEPRTSYKDYNDKAKFERIHHGTVDSIKKGTYVQVEHAI
jgi:hypothetical protein